MLVGEHGADEADRSLVVGEDPDHVGASFHFLVQPFRRVVRPDLALVLVREHSEGATGGRGQLSVRPDLFMVLSMSSGDLGERDGTGRTSALEKPERSLGALDASAFLAKVKVISRFQSPNRSPVACGW